MSSSREATTIKNSEAKPFLYEPIKHSLEKLEALRFAQHRSGVAERNQTFFYKNGFLI